MAWDLSVPGHYKWNGQDVGWNGPGTPIGAQIEAYGGAGPGVTRAAATASQVASPTQAQVNAGLAANPQNKADAPHNYSAAASPGGNNPGIAAAAPVGLHALATMMANPQYKLQFNEATAPPQPGDSVPAGQAQPIGQSGAQASKTFGNFLNIATPDQLNRLGFTNVDTARRWLDTASLGDITDKLNTLASPLFAGETNVNNFLANNSIGQAIAPSLAAGVGVSTGAGIHYGMTDPGIANNPATLTNAVQAAQQNAAGFNPNASQNVMPQNQGGTTYDGSHPALTNSNSVGYTPINVINGQSAVAHVGTAPVMNTPPASSLPDMSTGSAPAIQQAGRKSPVDAFNAGLNAAQQAAQTAQASANPTQTQAQANQNLLGEAAIAAGGVAGAVGTAAAGNAEATAAQNAATTQANIAQQALALQHQEFNQGLNAQTAALNQQQQNIAPWLAAGNTALGQLNDITSPNNWTQFGADQFNQYQDPGYSFRLDQGLKALQNSASARGGVLSGNTLKGISDYAQGSASQEYQNAFNRYQTERGARVNALQSMAGLGQSAVNQAGQATQNYANNASSLGANYANSAGQTSMAGANALAQGYLGAGNANASMYAGLGNALNNSISGALNYGMQNSLINALQNGNRTGS